MRGAASGDAESAGPGGASFPVAAPAPGCQRTWIDATGGVRVVGGEADLFAHRAGRAAEPTRRHFVARIADGGVIPGIPAGPLALEAVPLPGATLRDIPPGPLGPELVQGIDTALLAIADSVRAASAPRDATLLELDQIMSAAGGTVLMGNSRVLWLRVLGGAVRVNGRGIALDPADSELIVLSGRDWLEVERACTIETHDSMELMSAGLLDGALTAYLRRLLDVIDERIAARDAALLAAIAARKEADKSLVGHAGRAALGAVGVRAAQPTAHEQAHELRYRRIMALLAALLGAGAAAGLTEPADRVRLPDSDAQAVREVARSSGLHLREVELSGDWRRRDMGPLIGWRRPADAAAPDQAVALLFRRNRYHVTDPFTGESVRLAPAGMRSMRMAATQVQPPLPPGGGIRAALRLGMTGASRDVRGVLLAGGVAAGLGLAVPLVTGAVLGQMASSSSSAGRLRVLPAALVVAAVLAALSTASQNLHLLRAEGRIENGTQLALWDRLIRLPVTFFRTASSGELANAVLGISFIREALSGITVAAVSAALTAVLDFVLILVLSPLLGLAALGIMALCLIALCVLGTQVVRRGRAALPAEHRAVAFTNKLLTGIAKVKIASAEDRAYAQWAQLASRARGQLMSVRRIQAAAQALSAVLPIAGQLVLFLVIAGPLARAVAPGEFFTISVAFQVLLGSLLLLVSSGVEILAAMPRLAVLAPIVAADPERRAGHADPGDLRGEVSLVGVSFAYRPDAPAVLDGVTLHVRPGEFVAIVGPTGCGKSTLLRLLLGFERPTSGAVLFDGQDLADLDVQAVRRQCGIVLQDGALFAGSIRENISGAGNFALEQVWDAARLAGIQADIEGFPMGMNTLLPPGGGTLSAGQRQRILIARAVIHRPRLLLFDEATSALDNRTQEIVTASTRTLAATRLVIAHRLSTIVDADRIVVLDSGTIVQEGTFAELMGQPDGLFFRLASRQLVGGRPG